MGSVIEMDVVLVGFGTVGQGVAEAIAKKNALLERTLGENVRIVGAFDSSSYSLNKSGLDPLELVRGKMVKGKLGKRLSEDIKDILPKIEYDTLVEMTPTNIKNGQPGLGHIKAALSRGPRCGDLEQRTPGP